MHARTCFAIAMTAGGVGSLSVATLITTQSLGRRRQKHQSAKATKQDTAWFGTEAAPTGTSLATMSGQGYAVNGAAVRAGFGDAEPNLKRRRLLDAGGPIEDDATARRKMREAWVTDEKMIAGITGFDPENVCQKKYTLTFYYANGLFCPRRRTTDDALVVHQRFRYER